MARDGRRYRRDVSAHYAHLGLGDQGDNETLRDEAAGDGKSPSESGAYRYQSLSSSSRERVYQGRDPEKTPSRNILPFVLVALMLVGLVGGGVFWWNHRYVQVEINGDDTRVRIGSSIEEVRQACDLHPTPGNYVTVTGKLITEGAGWLYSAEVDGKNLHGKLFDNYRVHGGESIVISDGADKFEPYDVEIEEVQPKLRFKGEYGNVSYISQWGRVGKREIRTGKESGEVDRSHWKVKCKNCVVTTRNIRPEGQKLVCLTFDDGPSEYTPGFLDILAQKGVKATFFCITEEMKRFPDVVQAIVAGGHQIANHSRNHALLPSLNGDDLRDDLSSSFSTISEIAGVSTTTLRAPYGDFPQSCWLASQGMVSVAVMWNQDSLDWETPGVDAIVQNSLSGMENGSIILMHDGGGDRTQNIEAIAQIIDRWQAEGYTFVTVSELLEADGLPEKIASCNATMPKNRVWPQEIA